MYDGKLLVWFEAEIEIVLAAVLKAIPAPAARTIVPVEVAAPVPSAAT